MTKRFFEKIRKLRVILLSILVFVVVIVFLRWIYDTYDQQTMLLWIAILIAATTAVINSLSLDKTRQSLDLAIQSTRPFLTVTDVRYNPASPSDQPRILLSIRNTGLLPAHRLTIKFELRFDSTWGAHGQITQPSLKPDESGEVVFKLPPSVREIKPTEKTYLTISTQLFPHIAKTSFYHTKRKYSIPQGIETLDQPFAFVFRSGGDFD